MFRDLLKKSRSYRGYDESWRFTREDLAELVDDTRYAPSSVNIQPLKYDLAWEKEKVDLIQSLTKWGGLLPEEHLPHEGKHPTGFVVICQDMEISSSPTRFQKDVGIAAQTMLLAAAEKGLGGCMIGNFNAKQVKEALALPEHIEPMLIVAFGKPDETIVLEEAGPGESVKYYRDSEGRHHVPKRRLEDILL